MQLRHLVQRLLLRLSVVNIVVVVIFITISHVFMTVESKFHLDSIYLLRSNKYLELTSVFFQRSAQRNKFLPLAVTMQHRKKFLFAYEDTRTFLLN